MLPGCQGQRDAQGRRVFSPSSGAAWLEFKMDSLEKALSKAPQPKKNRYKIAKKWAAAEIVLDASVRFDWS